VERTYALQFGPTEIAFTVVMRSTLLPLGAIVLCAAALAGGMYLREHIDPSAPEIIRVTQPTTDRSAPKHRPEFWLPDPQGKRHGISEWDGKLLVMNFWATWCPPCLHEIPLFIALQERFRQRNVQFLGIAIDDGGAFDAASFREKVTIVTFWATWCPPCLDEMPLLQQARDDWGERGFRVFGVTSLFEDNESLAQRPDEIRLALDSHGAAYPVLITADQRDWGPYLVDSFPVTVLVDRDGIVVDYALGLKGLRRILERAEELLGSGN